MPQAETVESSESQEAKPNFIPDTTHASARGKTEENTKYSHTSPIKSTKSVIIVRGEPGAKCACERERTQNWLQPICASWMLLLLKLLLIWEFRNSFKYCQKQ